MFDFDLIYIRGYEMIDIVVTHTQKDEFKMNDRVISNFLPGEYFFPRPDPPDYATQISRKKMG